MKKFLNLLRANPNVGLYLPFVVTAVLVVPAFVWFETQSIRSVLFLGLLGIALVTPALLLFNRSVGRPLRYIRRGIDQFSRGNLGHRIPTGALGEFERIGAAMNEMAEQLADRVGLVESQRAEQHAVFSSMTEGVIAVRRDGRILRMNVSAEALLGTERTSAELKSIEEVIRNRDLQDFIRKAIEAHDPCGQEVVVYESEERQLLCKSTPLLDEDGGLLGTLVVMNDVTPLRKLERMRRDFVANVSHELKTPVTSIKAAAETLQSGALERMDDARKFTDIIARHADRLHAIIEDLLSLARIEEEQDARSAPMEVTEVHKIIRAALQLCEAKAAERKIELHAECSTELRAPMNHFLVEQAIVNLVDNAVKYSGTNSTVEVLAGRSGEFVTIAVMDTGCGIEKLHHDRLFERFYRVDQARSRKEGGTGLGLAIVKHVAQLHGGYPEVESVVGKGSTFTIYLRAEEPEDEAPPAGKAARSGAE